MRSSRHRDPVHTAARCVRTKVRSCLSCFTLGKISGEGVIDKNASRCFESYGGKVPSLLTSDVRSIADHDPCSSREMRSFVSSFIRRLGFALRALGATRDASRAWLIARIGSVSGMEVCRVAPKCTWSACWVRFRRYGHSSRGTRLRDRFASIRATVRFGLGSPDGRHLSLLSACPSRRFEARLVTLEWRECRIEYRVAVISSLFPGHSWMRARAPWAKIDTVRDVWHRMEQEWPAANRRCDDTDRWVNPFITLARVIMYLFVRISAHSAHATAVLDGRLIILDAFSPAEQPENGILFRPLARLTIWKLRRIRDLVRALSTFSTIRINVRW